MEGQHGAHPCLQGGMRLLPKPCGLILELRSAGVSPPSTLLVGLFAAGHSPCEPRLSDWRKHLPGADAVRGQFRPSGGAYCRIPIGIRLAGKQTSAVGAKRQLGNSATSGRHQSATWRQ